MSDRREIEIIGWALFLSAGIPFVLVFCSWGVAYLMTILTPTEIILAIFGIMGLIGMAMILYGRWSR